MRNCQHCGTAISGHGKRKFCSDSCKAKNHYKNGSSTVDRVCCECGKTFSFCTTKKSDGKFCSVECSGKHKRSGAYEFCWQCGKSVWKTESTKDKNFCSANCASSFRAEKQKQIQPKKCQQCGKEFAPRTESQKYCSIECSGMAKRKRVEFECAQCGAKATRRDYRDKTFCSRTCQSAHAKTARIEKAKTEVCPFIAKIQVVECQQCGEKFLTKTNATLCSDECKKQINRKSLARYYKNKPKGKLTTCKVCSCVFMSTQKHKKCCSPVCAKTNEQAGRKQHEYKREQAKRNRAIGGSIAPWLARVKAKRNIQCYWCGKKVNAKKIHVDHIVPLSVGGAHGVENVCASCPECNIEKSNRHPGEWACAKGMLNLT